LIGTYKLINPATENPRSISALTLLSRGADRAESELADQPVVHARILQTLGQAYINLGLSRELVDIMGRSRSAIQKAGPQGAGAWLQLADAYFNLDRPAEAMAAVNSAEQALGRPTEANRLARADIAELRGRIYYGESDLKRGLASLDTALALYHGVRNTPPRRIAAALKTRGLVLSDEGRYAEAEASLLKYLSICRSALGEKHFLTGDAWYALALNDVAAGKLDNAESRIQNALAVERVVLDPDNPILADAYSVEGDILHGKNKLSAAAAAYEQAISIYHKAYKRPQYSIGIALVSLALVESDLGHVDTALADLAEAKYNYDVSYGKLHPNHGDLLVNRAKVLAHAGRRAEALADCAAGVKILDQTLGADAAFTKTNVEICAKL
jgi:tetratricopeptide (TPR) repeat protein